MRVCKGSLLAMTVMMVVAIARTGSLQAADEPVFAPLTPSERTDIDERIRTYTLDRSDARPARLASGAGEWLIERAAISPRQERRLAKAEQARLLEDVPRLSPPPEAVWIFDRLVAELPARMKPPEFDFELIALDNPDQESFTFGGGTVFITAGLLDSLLAETAQPTGTDMLAFVLAHELGHLCRGHSRHVYQVRQLQQRVGGDLVEGTSRTGTRKWAHHLLGGAAGVTLWFQHPDQEFEADLFALHLCRNAGFNSHRGLDVLRSLIRHERELPQPVADSDEAAQEPGDPSAEVASTPPRTPAERRLQRLLHELGFIPPGTGYGLFRLDPTTGEASPLADGELAGRRNVILFVHGMESSLQSLRSIVARAAERAEGDDVTLLGFQYPHDDSLAMAGNFLTREIQRTAVPAEHTRFVCHSAGGLVVRWYLEVDRGRCQQAVFLGTPHGGSHLSSLRILLEAKQFFGELPLGFPTALENTLTDGHGQIRHDLEPDSLFFRHLNHRERRRPLNRYVVIRGRAMKRRYAVLAEAGTLGLRRGLATAAEKCRLPEEDRGNLVDWVSRFRLPEEIIKGDLAVSLENATLDGVPTVHTFRVNHLRMMTHPDVLATLSESLADDR